MTKPVRLEDEEPYNPGDSDHVAKRRKTAKFERETELEHLKLLLESLAGRKFLWRLVTEQCGLYASIETMVDEGKRRVGLWILNEIKLADPQAFVNMQAENT
jgi:hypothetical protein